jgi:hypothetical protein
MVPELDPILNPVSISSSKNQTQFWSGLVWFGLVWFGLWLSDNMIALFHWTLDLGSWTFI